MTKDLKLSRSIQSRVVSNVNWGDIMEQTAAIYMHVMVIYMKGKAVKIKQVNMEWRI
jgi:hypothetical protein